jgi:hypothetical protein
VGIGVSVSWWYTEDCWMPMALFVAFAFIMQIVIALLFYMCGHLDEYVLKYENAVS